MEQHLDTLILRTFVVAAEHGEFAHTAAIVGRSQGAVSMQIQKLETIVGQRLFERSRQGVSLTDAGERLVVYAREILAMKEKTINDMRGFDVSGTVRIGMPQDFAESILPEILGSFTRSHPEVQLVAQVGRNDDLVKSAKRNELDLVLSVGMSKVKGLQEIARIPSVWVGPVGYVQSNQKPVRLVAFDAPCIFREMTAKALRQAGLDWETTMISTSLHGLWAAARAGLGISVRTPLQIPDGLSILGPETGLPQLPDISLNLYRQSGKENLAADRLETLLVEQLKSKLSGQTRVWKVR